MTRKSQGKINQGGTDQREHKLRQGATKDFHSESGNQRQEKMREERSFTKWEKAWEVVLEDVQRRNEAKNMRYSPMGT